MRIEWSYSSSHRRLLKQFHRSHPDDYDTLAKAMNEALVRCGIPKSVVSDNGPQFAPAEFSTLRVYMRHNNQIF